MRLFLYIFGAFIILYILFVAYCSLSLKLTHATLLRPSRKESGTTPIKRHQDRYIAHKYYDAATSNNEGLNVLFFSDLHMPFTVLSPKRLIKIIKKYQSSCRIDAVIFGGDFANNKAGLIKAISFVKELAAYLDENKIPFGFVTGNHDVDFADELRSELRTWCLDGTTFTIERGGKTYEISGVSDSGRKNRIWPSMPCEDAPSSSSCAGSADNAPATKILIAHNPDWLLNAISEHSQVPDFMLSGHLHDGQIKLPFKLEFTLLRKDKLPKLGVTHGVYDLGNTSVFISSGAGNVLLPLRHFSMAEVTLVHLE